MATPLRSAETRIPTAAALGAAIRAVRQARGLTQGELAQRALTSRQTINAIEAGRETRGVEVLFDSLAALGLELVMRPRRGR